MQNRTDLKIEKKLIPTYEPKEPIEMPMFFEKKPYQGASGRLYPLQFTDSLCDENKTGNTLWVFWKMNI